MTKVISVLVADELTQNAAMLIQALESSDGAFCVTHVATLAQLAAYHDQRQAHVLLLSRDILPVPATKVLSDLRQRFPATGILLLIDDDGQIDLQACLESGIAGYVLRSDSIDTMITAVKAVANDHLFLPVSARNKLIKRLTEKNRQRSWLPGIVGITDREWHLLTFLSQGLSNQQMAQQLDLAPKTIRNYLTVLYKKIEVQSRAEAIVWINQHGLFADDS